MAEVIRLKRFAYQSLIDKYAVRYGLDPDLVFTDCSMDSLINILEMAKEEEEFSDRFSNLWALINKPV